MFKLMTTEDGRKYLKFVKRTPGEPKVRGLWVEIVHCKTVDAEYYANFNRQMGLQVEIDEEGFYRALVLKD